MTQKISSALCAYFLVYIYIRNHLFRIYASFEMKESLPQPRHKVQPGLNTLQFYGIHSTLEKLNTTFLSPKISKKFRRGLFAKFVAKRRKKLTLPIYIQWKFWHKDSHSTGLACVCARVCMCVHVRCGCGCVAGVLCVVGCVGGWVGSGCRKRFEKFGRVPKKHKQIENRGNIRKFRKNNWKFWQSRPKTRYRNIWQDAVPPKSSLLLYLAPTPVNGFFMQLPQGIRDHLGWPVPDRAPLTVKT